MQGNVDATMIPEYRKIDLFCNSKNLAGREIVFGKSIYFPKIKHVQHPANLHKIKLGNFRKVSDFSMFG